MKPSTSLRSSSHAELMRRLERALDESRRVSAMAERGLAARSDTVVARSDAHEPSRTRSALRTV